MKDAPSLMLNRLGWLLAEDCTADGGSNVPMSVNCPSAGAVYRDTKSVRNVALIIIKEPNQFSVSYHYHLRHNIIYHVVVKVISNCKQL